jgi:uncharacterized protein (TIGR00297 family)
MLSLIDSLNPWLMGLVLNTILLGIVAIIPKKLLTPAGILNAGLLGIIIWGTLGWQGYLVVVFYFLVGSGVTRIGMAEKEAAGIAEKRAGARGPENVWGSALIAAFCALGLLFFPDFKYLLCLGYVASFSTKLSDTTASEVGKAYGKSTFLITTLQPVPRGTEGAVSLEGTLAGMVAVEMRRQGDEGEVHSTKPHDKTNACCGCRGEVNPRKSLQFSRAEDIPNKSICFI